jgi:hypothetical protein
MENRRQTHTDLGGYLRQIFFTLNLALIAKLWGNQRPNKVFSYLDFHEFAIQLKINSSLHLAPHNNVGANAAFLILTFGLSLCIFLLISFLATILPTKSFLKYSGIVSLTLLPISWLFVSRLLDGVSSFSVLSNGMLLLETLAIAFCGIAFWNGKWNLPAWASIILLAAHFGFWHVICFGLYFWRSPFQSIFATVGFCSSLLWAIYVPGRNSETEGTFPLPSPTRSNSTSIII